MAGGDGIADALRDGLAEIAESISAVARSIDRLGLADAATPMGAIEVLSREVRDGMVSIAGAMESVAEAIGNHD